MKKQQLINNIVNTKATQLRHYKKIKTYIRSTPAGTKAITKELYHQEQDFRNAKGLTQSKLKNLSRKELLTTYRKLGVQAGNLRKSTYTNKHGKTVTRYLKQNLTQREHETLKINKAVLAAKKGEDEFEKLLEEYLLAKELYESGQISEEDFKQAQSAMSDAATTQNVGLAVSPYRSNIREQAFKNKIENNGALGVSGTVGNKLNFNDIKHANKSEFLTQLEKRAKLGAVNFSEITDLGKSTVRLISPAPPKQLVKEIIKDRIQRYNLMNVIERTKSRDTLEVLRKGYRTASKSKTIGVHKKQIIKANLNITNQILKVIKKWG